MEEHFKILKAAPARPILLDDTTNQNAIDALNAFVRFYESHMAMLRSLIAHEKELARFEEQMFRQQNQYNAPRQEDFDEHDQRMAVFNNNIRAIQDQIGEFETEIRRLRVTTLGQLTRGSSKKRNTKKRRQTARRAAKKAK